MIPNHITTISDLQEALAHLVSPACFKIIQLDEDYHTYIVTSPEFQPSVEEAFKLIQDNIIVLGLLSIQFRVVNI